MKRRAALYLRVSTQEQDEATQIPDLTRMARARGFRIVSTFRERASSVGQRPELARLRKSAHEGQFDVVLVWALDRLGRSLFDNIRIVLELERNDVEVISCREPWLDTKGPVRDLLLAIFSWVAEQERKRMGERTRAGIARARARGERIGRPKNMFDLRRARELAEAGFTVRQIAQRVRAPRSTVARRLKKARSSKGSPARKK